MFFAAGAFLAGLTLLAVPWWLHRLNAHAAERQTFSSLFLMRASAAPVNMRKKVQYLQLLALRCLLVFAICLAFAEPMINVAGGPTASGEPVAHQLIVLDTSLSMRRSSSTGVSVMDTAKRQARQLVDALPTGTKAAIVGIADRIEVMAPLTTDRAQLSAAVGATQAGAARLTMNGLMGRITSMGETMAAPGEAQTVHLISDFQASAMPDQFNALIEGSVWPLSLHSVSETNRGNWAVSAMRHDPSAEPAALHVTVRGYATEAGTLPLSLAQNGTQTGTKDLFVPADGSATAIFELPPATRGTATWTAELSAPDDLAADNVRRLVQTDTEIASLPVFSESDRAYAYLRVAVLAAAPRFAAVRASDMQDAAVPVVALVDPGVMRSAAERALVTHLESGGGVFMTAGPATRAAGYLPLLGLPLVSDRFAQSPRGAVAQDRNHPALAGFGGWQDVTFYQAVKTVEDASKTSEVILKLDDGTPLLVEYRVGAGRLLLLTTALDPAWSSLVVRPAFVDFMANLLGYLAEDLLPAEALVGQPFAIPAHSVQLFDDRGERVLGLAQTVGRPTVSLATPGVYQLRTPGSNRLLAVNTDPAESDLATAPAELLARWQASSSRERAAEAAMVIDNDTFDARTDEAEPNQTLALAPWLLALLALLVFAEPLLANTGLLQRRTDQTTP